MLEEVPVDAGNSLYTSAYSSTDSDRGYRVMSFRSVADGSALGSSHSRKIMAAPVCI